MFRNPIPYGKQTISEADIEAVAQVLRSSHLTTGPEVERFERALAEYCGAAHAISFNSGTSALHAAYHSIGIGPGDSIVTTPITFAATSNAALMLGATVNFADVDIKTGNLCPKLAESAIQRNTKAIVPVDFAGLPVDMEAFSAISKRHELVLIEDACHSLGAHFKGSKVGGLADMTVFSFHPVKSITTAEGGAIVTNNQEFADRARRFRNHGISRNANDQASMGLWFYAVNDIGYNYRLSDVHAALGRSQLTRIDEFIAKRRAIASEYFRAFSGIEGVITPTQEEQSQSSWHLFWIRVPNATLRRSLFEFLHEHGILAQVHYIPVYQHPFYQAHPDSWRGICPNADEFYKTCLSLPIYPELSEEDQSRVVDTVSKWALAHL